MCPGLYGVGLLDSGSSAAAAVTVTNTGSRPGATVAQLYIRPHTDGIDRPFQELKGFSRVDLAPGESKAVTMQLDRRAFAHWDTTMHAWQVLPGAYEIAVGSSSREIQCVSSVAMK